LPSLGWFDGLGLMSIVELWPFVLLVLTLYGIGAFAANVLGHSGGQQAAASWTTPGDIPVLGAAVFLAASGWLIAFDAYSRAWLIGALIVALVTLIALSLRRPRTLISGPSLVLLAAIVGIGFCQMFSALARNEFNWCDDTTYLYLLERLRETGGLIDPWNNRRLTSLGGQTVLQAAFLGGQMRTTFLAYDFVIGGVLLTAQMLGTDRLRRDALLAGVAALAIVASSPDSVGQQANSCPRFIPTALLLAVVQWSARLGTAPDAYRARLSVALGCVIAALATVRAPFAAVAGVAVLSLFFVWRERGRRLAAISAAALVAATSVSLGGWCIGLYRSSGSWLFPLAAGNLNPSWPANGPDGATSIELRWERLLEWFTSPGILAALLAATAAVALLPGGSAVRRWWCLAMPVALTAAVLPLLVFALQKVDITSRFHVPVLVAFLLALVQATAATGCDPRVGTRSAQRWFTSAKHQQLLSLVLAVLALLMVVRPTWSHGQASADPAHSGVAPFRGGVGDEPWSFYRAAQQALPAEASVLAAVDFPQALGFGRRALSAMDLIDSTAPGQPPALDAAPLVRLRWLRDMGVSHLVVEDPAHSRCLFNAVLWAHNLRYPSGVWLYWTPYQLNWFRFVQTLGAAAGTRAFGPLLVVPIADVLAQSSGGSRGSEPDSLIHH